MTTVRHNHALFSLQCVSKDVKCCYIFK